MLSTPEKTVILAGALAGSVFLCGTALASLNAITINRYNDENRNIINKLIAVNGLTMLFSGLAFTYFTYKAIK